MVEELNGVPPEPADEENRERVKGQRVGEFPSADLLQDGLKMNIEKEVR